MIKLLPDTGLVDSTYKALRKEISLLREKRRTMQPCALDTSEMSAQTDLFLSICALYMQLSLEDSPALPLQELEQSINALCPISEHSLRGSIRWLKSYMQNTNPQNNQYS